MKLSLDINSFFAIFDTLELIINSKYYQYYICNLFNINKSKIIFVTKSVYLINVSINFDGTDDYLTDRRQQIVVNACIFSL